MDLGIDRAGTRLSERAAGSAGRSPRRSAARASGGASASRSAEGSKRSRPRSAPGRRSAGRHRRRDAVAALPAGSPRRSGRSRSSSSTPAARRRRRARPPIPTNGAAYRSLVLAPLIAARGCLPGMRERGWGRIVNVSSTSVREPIPGLALSNSNRMAALGLLNTLARRGRRRRHHGQHGRDRPVRHRAARQQIYGSLEAAEERARADVPAGRLGTPRGVRRPRRVHLLRAGGLPDRRRDPARRRAHPFLLRSPGRSPPGGA